MAAVPVGKTMTICKHCGKDIEDPRTTTCIKDYIEYQDGLTLPRKPFDDNENERCPVCHVIRGAFHHKGCYVERCPRCGQRLVSCGCLIKGKEWRQPER